MPLEMGRCALAGIDSVVCPAELGCFGLIIEPMALIRNQELEVSIPNWPPPVTAITYVVHYKGNYVYRIESAEILDKVPEYEAGAAELLGGAGHLIDAIESLGVDRGRTWAGCCTPVTDSVSRVVAWAV